MIPRLQSELPELLVLGDYAPERRTGPAIWLRCVIAGKVSDVTLPTDRVPVFYLPGVSRHDLRAIEDCPDRLKPLAELQYRGVIWSQANAKDWTIMAFLKSDQGGLGLDVAQDKDAKTAMQLALHRLLDEELELLKGKRLDKDDFNSLLTGGDPVRDLQERSLQQDLLGLKHLPAHEARKRLLELEKAHAPRRDLVWAELGESPLALAAKHLALVAEVTKTALAAASVADLQAAYATQGWRADDAVLSALASVDKAPDVEAVTAAIRATYLPWLEESARYLQTLVDGSSYPGGTIATAKAFAASPGECVLFVDGLRFDVARRLSAILETAGFQVAEAMRWTALPSVTATGKAAASPVRTKISGTEDCADFEPCVAATGQSLKGGYHLKKQLNDNHWKVLDRADHGDGQGNAWCEFGDIDSEGHARGWKLAKHIDPLLAEIAERVDALLAAGWSSVRVVTDHGWLLMPGQLPRIQMSQDLTETKWGRCAAIKPGASTNERRYPWFWNPHQQFALADGVGCYGKSVVFFGGALSGRDTNAVNRRSCPGVSRRATRPRRGGG